VAYALVHGGGATSAFWDRLIPLLDASARAVDLPGRGARPADLATITVDDEVASVVADLGGGPGADLGDEIVLVAHSSGGLPVPGIVADLRARIAHVVLIAALVPPEGGCGLDCMQPRHRDGLRSVVEASGPGDPAITLPGAPADPEPFRTAYGGDPLDDDTLAFVVDPRRCVPDGVHHYFQPVHWSGVAGVPVTYVLTERDRPVPTAMQEEMAARLPGPVTVVRLDTGHIPPVTHPDLVADLLARIPLDR
jgi:pimeloyl-ACP methyl ester carboxylesterase